MANDTHQNGLQQLIHSLQKILVPSWTRYYSVPFCVWYNKVLTNTQHIQCYQLYWHIQSHFKLSPSVRYDVNQNKAILTALVQYSYKDK